MKKVFCIGLPKTGTTSLAIALRSLGYNVAPYDIDLINRVAKGDCDTRGVVDSYNAFEDWPWPFLKDSLIHDYSDALFILTVRKSAEIWYNSLLKHTIRSDSDNSRYLRQIFYGNSDVNNIDYYIQFYNDFNVNVINAFKYNKTNLLVICFENGDGWEELCGFLEVSRPNLPFPKANTSKENEKWSRKVIKIVRKIKKLFF